MVDFVFERQDELVLRIWEHLYMTGGSVGLALILGLPLGVWARRRPVVEGIVLGFVGTMQTIPGLALLTLLMVALSHLPALPLIGRIPALGTAPAVIALTLYALLPITRNAVAGLRGVPQAALEAAEALGMTRRQKLWLVELPLALPVIVAGMRTATVIGVGVTTLAAFIGAGGLGAFINRGLYMSHHGLVLLGAIPAALLALLLDHLLALAEVFLAGGPRRREETRRAVRGVVLAAAPLVVLGALLAGPGGIETRELPMADLRAGFTGEFIERPDGLRSLEAAYGFRFASVRDIEASLMYQALSRGEVDVISAYSTDGRLAAFQVKLLEDDKNFFPPYDAAPIVRLEAAAGTPGLVRALELVAGRIDEKTMRRLNFEVDQRKRRPKKVVSEFLKRQGLLGALKPRLGPPIVVGSKNFTEGLLLGEIMAQLIETHLGRRVNPRFNLGGTMVVHQALAAGDIDVYAEYTGTALAAILGLPTVSDSQEAYRRVSEAYPRRYASRWLRPFGFNNTYALGIRSADSQAHGWTRISDLNPNRQAAKGSP